MVAVPDLPNAQRALQEQPQRQVRQLGLRDGRDGRVAELDDLLALFVPILVLAGDRFVVVRELERLEHQRRQDVFDPLRTARPEVLSRRLQDLVLHVEMLGLEKVDEATDDALLFSEVVGVQSVRWLIFLIFNQRRQHRQNVIDLLVRRDHRLVLQNVHHQVQRQTFARRVVEALQQPREEFQVEDRQHVVVEVDADAEQAR